MPEPYPKHYLAEVPQDLRLRVLDLCIHRQWQEALALLHEHGFTQYEWFEVVWFHDWAPTNLNIDEPPVRRSVPAEPSVNDSHSPICNFFPCRLLPGNSYFWHTTLLWHQSWNSCGPSQVPVIEGGAAEPAPWHQGIAGNISHAGPAEAFVRTGSVATGNRVEHQQRLSAFERCGFSSPHKGCSQPLAPGAAMH